MSKKTVREALEKLIDSYDYATDVGGGYNYEQALSDIWQIIQSCEPEKRDVTQRSSIEMALQDEFGTASDCWDEGFNKAITEYTARLEKAVKGAE